MKNLELKILTKIIRELSHFLLVHGFKTFSLETKVEDKVTYFVISIDQPKKALLDKMNERISRERELEVETYGWELLGDMDDKNELDVLGLLIDDIVIEEKPNQAVITLSRVSRYKD